MNQTNTIPTMPAPNKPDASGVTRYILAAVYGHPDIEPDYSHAIIEVSHLDLAVVRQARATAKKFDAIPPGVFRESAVTSGSMLGEYVFKRLPEGLGAWLAEQGDEDGELPRLIPQELGATIEDIIEREWRNGDNCWASSTIRWKCTATEVRAEIECKYDYDVVLRTRDLSQIMSALDGDPKVLGFSVEEEVSA